MKRGQAKLLKKHPSLVLTQRCPLFKARNREWSKKSRGITPAFHWNDTDIMTTTLPLKHRRTHDGTW